MAFDIKNFFYSNVLALVLSPLMAHAALTPTVDCQIRARSLQGSDEVHWHFGPTDLTIKMDESSPIPTATAQKQWHGYLTVFVVDLVSGRGDLTLTSLSTKKTSTASGPANEGTPVSTTLTLGETQVGVECSAFVDIKSSPQ